MSVRAPTTSVRASDQNVRALQQAVRAAWRAAQLTPTTYRIDHREERRYNNRDHHHHDWSKSLGQAISSPPISFLSKDKYTSNIRI
jgi:hypothetical protein